jgi:predicted RNA-binding protein (virulence factor B family)
MEIRIGIKNAGRELAFESDQSAAEIEATVASALSGGSKVLSLSDNKGRKFVVPSDALAYLEIGAEESRRVGFIA